MTIRDCYIILGVTPHTSMAEVRRRYRALARQYHPDHHPNDPEATARFRQLAAAYEALQQFRTRSRSASQNLRRPRFTRSDELFEEFFGISGDQEQGRYSTGAAFRYDLEVPLAAAVRGTQTVIQVDRTFSCRPCRGTGLALGTGYSTCQQCQGRGRRYGGPGLLRFGPICHRCGGRGKIITQNCPQCHGQGSTLGTREYRLHIPPGTEDGTRLCLDGEGGEGFENGPPGNLEVVIHVAPDDFFSRRGRDIHCQVKVPFAEALRGGFILVPTLDGYRTVQLPQGTQSGWVVRFHGAGAPGSSGLPPGDQVMEIVVVASPGDFSLMPTEPFDVLSRLEAEIQTRVRYD